VIIKFIGAKDMPIGINPFHKLTFRRIDMKKSLKHLTLVLAMILAMVLLAGCGAKDD